MHRRHPGIEGDLLEDDVLRRGRGVEPRVQDEFGPQTQPEHQDDRKPEDVEERQDGEEALLAFPQRLRQRLCRLQILRAGHGQVGVGQHCAFGQASRAAGVLDDRERLARIADGMRPVAPVIVEEVAERGDALVAPDLRQHLLRRHEGFHRARRERVFGEFSDNEPLQPRRAEKLLGLRIERCEVEGDEDIRVAVADLEL